MTDLPDKALSIRQPWAWAILHAGKDVENRTWNTKFRGPVCIHAAKAMTKKEHSEFVEIARSMARASRWPNGAWIPFPDDLDRGGIIGTAEIVDCIEQSDSPWWMGPFGLVLENIHPVEFIPVKGALGLFDWKRNLT